MSAEDLPRKLRQLREQPRAGRKRGPIVVAALDTVAVREQVQSRLIDCLEPLREMAPLLRPVKRVDSGCWRLGLAQQLDPEQRKGRTARPYSRCEFTLAFDTVRRRLDLECRATAFDRDLPTLRLAQNIDAVDWRELEDWIEGACLAFAERWIAGEALAAQAARTARVTS